MLNLLSKINPLLKKPPVSEACVLIDIQSQYVDRDFHSLKRIEEALPDIRARMPLIWVFMDSYGDEVHHKPATVGNDNFSALYNSLANPHPMVERNTPMFVPEQGDWFMTKKHCDVFRDGEMAPFLRDQGIGKINVVGYCESVCVLQSAAGAISDDFKARVVRDLTGEQPQGASSETLSTYRKRRIPHVSSKELLLSPVK